MQFRALVAFLFAAAAPSVAISVSSSATAESKAVAWLQQHRGAPQPDDLAELKATNPSAYALVKALLTKRSLGLLDPKHPSASFAAAKAPEEVPGAEAFQKIAADSGEKPAVAPIYAGVPSSSGHHDWLNWKPQQSAADDEAMVNNVLGAVASLKGSQAVARQEPAKEASDSPAAAAVAVAPQPVEAAPAVKPKASMNQENSYLKGLDLDGSASAASSKSKRESGSNKNFLASFSWDDDASKSAEPVVPQAMQPVQVPSIVAASQQESALPAQAVVASPSQPVAQPKKKNALLDWLSPQPVQKVAPPTAAPAQQESSYLSMLN